MSSTAVVGGRAFAGRSAAGRPAGGRSAGGPAGRVQLTRRGRLVVVLGVLAMLVVGFSIGGHVSSQAASSAGVQHARTVTVQPGESLWALAERIAPHADPRLVVARIAQINHLPGADVSAGQQLVVPQVR